MAHDTREVDRDLDTAERDPTDGSAVGTTTDGPAVGTATVDERAPDARTDSQAEDVRADDARDADAADSGEYAAERVSPDGTYRTHADVDADATTPTATMADEADSRTDTTTPAGMNTTGTDSVGRDSAGTDSVGTGSVDRGSVGTGSVAVDDMATDDDVLTHTPAVDDGPGSDTSPDDEVTATEGLMPGQADAGQVSPLWPDGSTDSLRQRWEQVQLRFVDDPRDAAQQARALVSEAVDMLTVALANQRDSISTAAGGDDTEVHRSAVVRYRELFERLLSL